MKRFFIKEMVILASVLLLPNLEAWAGSGQCPPNCNQPSSSTINQNNQVITQIYALLDQETMILNQMQGYPGGAPLQIFQQIQQIQDQIELLSTQLK